MRVFVDIFGDKITLTDERLAHILEHPEMIGQINKMAQVLLKPEKVTQSQSDETVRLYYRWQNKILDGKYICVAVKWSPRRAFVITSYFTDRIKKGVTIWQK